jgi:DNA recombination protein RmuC
MSTYTILGFITGSLAGAAICYFILKRFFATGFIPLAQLHQAHQEAGELKIQLAACLTKDVVARDYVLKAWFDDCNRQINILKEDLKKAQDQILSVTAISEQKLSRQQVETGFVSRETFDAINKELNEWKEKLSVSAEKNTELVSENTFLKTGNDNLSKKLSELKDEFETWQANAKEQFENLTNKIFSQTSKDFVDTNRLSLETLLGPFKTDLTTFQKRVEETRKEDIQELTSLKKEIETLQKLNSVLSEDAQKLANALKSDVRIQGNWGEDRLNLILEAEGLQKHIDFSTQGVYKDEEEKNKKPDFILNLPDGKHIIIDSKVSLNAYVEYFNCTDTNQKKECLRRLVKNISDHIDGLSSKNYQLLDGVNAPDFVCMFMPIEGALSLAMNELPELVQRALNKKVVILTPTTLVATAKIIKLLWQKENRVKNVEEIFRQCGALYDKFVTFVDEMQAIGTSLQNASGSYKKAMDHLKDGQRKGVTIIGRFETIKELEAKTSKSLPQNLLKEVEFLDEPKTIDLSANNTFQ